MKRVRSLPILGRLSFLFRSPASYTKPVICLLHKRLLQKNPSALFSSVVFAATLVKNQDANRTSLKIADPETLTYSYLISQAISLTGEAAMQVLMQTTLAVLEAELKYRQDLENILSLLEQHLTIRGNTFLEEQVWNEIVAVRSESETKKKVCNELELFLSSVKNLVEAAAETAFQGKCDFCTVTIGERLQSAIREIDDSKAKTKNVERQYLKLYSKIIKTEKPPEEKEE